MRNKKKWKVEERSDNFDVVQIKRLKRMSRIRFIFLYVLIALIRENVMS